MKFNFIKRFNPFFSHVYFNEVMGKEHLGPNVSSFSHDLGCMVSGSGAMEEI